MEYHETHIGISPDGERYGLGESMGWEHTSAKTFGALYREIMKWGLPNPDTGLMQRPRCIGRIYVDSKHVEARPVGWVFLMRCPEGYKREIWVEARA